MQLTVACK